jgi:hypothetical protein
MYANSVLGIIEDGKTVKNILSLGHLLIKNGKYYLYSYIAIMGDKFLF